MTFKQDEIDRVFLNKSKTFEEALTDLILLENYLQKDYSRQKNKLGFYKENARKTKRKYTYYQEYIEPFFTRVYIGSDKSYKKLYRSLDNPIKYFLIGFTVINILFALLLLLTAGIAIYQAKLFSAFLIILFGLGIILRLFNFIVKINYLILLLLVDGILILFKKNRGRLYKNIKILDMLTRGWWSSNKNGILLTGVGAASYSSFGGGGGGFGSFGGGSFGGGGAGGSW